MMRFILAVFFSFFFVSVAGFSAAAEIDDHPLITSYEGSVATRAEVEDFQRYKLIVGVLAESLNFEFTDLEGRMTRINYENPRDRSALEILANYRRAIIGAGGEILFDCMEDACGPAHAGSRWRRFNGTLNLPGVGGYIASRIETADGIAYIAIAVAKRRHQITVLEVAEMDDDMVTLDPDALGEELDVLGHVIIPEVYFDTGKAVLSPQSRTALDVMAQILQARPDANIWIVGHTDWTGNFDFNMRLSQDRAKAVVEALVRDYGINRGRLEGHGVGPLAPAASNRSETGRGANRRVELVLAP